MNLNQLKYALAVARHKSFSRAARACHVSQPSLSVAVKNLEEELGLPLFERFKNEIRITERGATVLDQMHKTLEAAAGVRRVAEGGGDPLTGPLRLGAILTIGPYLFPGVIPPFRALAPGAKLFLEENFTAVLSERLKRGDLDAIIIALPYQEHGVELLPLYDEPFVAAVPESHPWRDRADLTGQELAGDELIVLGKGNCFRDQVLEICPGCMRLETAAADQPGNIIEGSSLETIRHMVATGVGVSVLPVSSVNSVLCGAAACPARENRLVRYIPFRDPAPARRIALVWRSSFPRRAAIEALAEAIRQAPPAGVRLLAADGAGPEPDHVVGASHC